jgi:hypothetical protein
MCDTTISSSACVRSTNSRISAATVPGAPTNETRDRRSGSPASRRSRSHSFDGGGSWIGRPERRLANDWRPDEARNRASSSVSAATTFTPSITYGAASSAG